MDVSNTMSILRVIQPWIKQYLNAHLIDPTVHLIEEQLEARKVGSTARLLLFT